MAFFQGARSTDGLEPNFQFVRRANPDSDHPLHPPQTAAYRAALGYRWRCLLDPIFYSATSTKLPIDLAQHVIPRLDAMRLMCGRAAERTCVKTARLLVVTGLWPTSDNRTVGTFVRDRLVGTD